jgi:hypothetical protein
MKRQPCRPRSGGDWGGGGQLWRKTLPLAFTARHSHRIGGCSGRLLLDAWGVEFRSSEHERWRSPEMRALEREDARSCTSRTPSGLQLLPRGRPLADADWAVPEAAKK